MNASHNHSAKWLAVILLAASFCAAETPNDFKCGPIDCDVLKNNPDARFDKMIVNAKDGKPPLLDHVAELRTRFWEMYSFDPTSKDCDNAREQFAQALFEKDLHYLQPNVIARVYAPNPHRLTGEQEDLPTQLADLLSGGVDGGIPRAAQPEFYAWVNAMRDALGPAHTFDDHFMQGLEAGSGILSQTYRKAMNLGGKEYQDYVMERDWAEFSAINRVPAGYNHKETYGVFLYFRAGNNSFRDANIIYAGMEEALGKDVVQAAAEIVRTAPKTDTGDLVKRADLGEPVKISPSGERLPDYDAPTPQGVIGVYKDPALALEILATQDDDRRYLLYLLKHQYWKNASSIKQATNEWTFAAALYQQLTIAFGEPDVQEAAARVRKATKRWISGNVMDQQAIGATRNVPLEAFEDILTRKNPKGYVRATLAFDQNLQTPQAVDAAYAKYIQANGGEQKVLDVAKTIASAKPNFGFQNELDALTRFITRPPAPQAQEMLVDNPEYLAWKGFQPGAKASYVTQIWLSDRTTGKLVPGHVTERHTFTLRSIDDNQALFWLTEIAYDADGAAHPPHDSEMAYPAKIPAPRTRVVRSQSVDPPTPSRGKRPAQQDAAAGQENTLPSTTAMSVPSLNTPTPSGRFVRLFKSAAGSIESGQEVLRIGNQKIAAQWQSQMFPLDPRFGDRKFSLIVKVWTSDAVPSGLVRKTQDTFFPLNQRLPPSRSVEETWLESFSGSREGVAVVDPSLPVGGQYSPPPMTFAGGTTTPANNPQRNTPDAIADRQASRYSADMLRLSQATQKVIRLQQQGTPIPDDVAAARGRIVQQIRAVRQQIVQRQTDEADQTFKELEESLSAIEKFVNQ